jgi:hypothetical protein
MQSPSLAAFALLALLFALAVAALMNAKSRFDAISYYPNTPILWQVR